MSDLVVTFLEASTCVEALRGFGAAPPVKAPPVPHDSTGGPHGSPRALLVEDGAGPLMLAAFRESVDGVAHLGAPLFDPRAAGLEGRLMSEAADALALRNRTAVVAVARAGDLVERYLRAGGFIAGPRLVEMSSPSRHATVEGSWTFVPYEASARRLFASVFYRTLEGSLDAPEIPVCRDADAMMLAFEERGAFDAEDFALLGTLEAPAGILLAVVDKEALEIIYLGVLPEMRGKGLGAVLVARAFERAKAHGAGVVRTFVDEKNAPAVALYRRHGFSERRAVSVYVRPSKKF